MDLERTFALVTENENKKKKKKKNNKQSHKQIRKRQEKRKMSEHETSFFNLYSDLKSLTENESNE